MRLRNTLILCTIFIFMNAPAVLAEEQKQGGGPPPMLVETAHVTSGQAEPMSDFVGTVYYARSAQVAAEVSGLVVSVITNDGDSVSKGAPLISLDDDILLSEIKATRASFEQSQLDFEQAVRDYDRIARLHEQDAIATTEYEAYRTRSKNLEKQVVSLRAQLDKQLLQQEKKKIRAPFEGLVIETLVESGEWVPVGGTVARVADNRSFEILVDIPANLTSLLEAGRVVSATISNRTIEATFMTIIPKGDIATRTFTAKFSVKHSPGLIEGMQANVMLPTEMAIDGLLVPRDAVLKQFGRDVVFLAEEGVAKMVPVQVMGYQGMQAAVTGEGLETGQQVVTKGNERIRDGQPVRF